MSTAACGGIFVLGDLPKGCARELTTAEKSALEQAIAGVQIAVQRI